VSIGVSIDPKESRHPRQAIRADRAVCHDLQEWRWNLFRVWAA